MVYPKYKLAYGLKKELKAIQQKRSFKCKQEKQLEA